jgi:predicted RNA-binding protein with PIN domain
VYLIDGYNLLFRIEDQKLSLEQRREALIAILADELSLFRFSAAIVFDGDDSIRKYASRTFFERLEVSSDSGLLRQCAHLGAKTLSIECFVAKLTKKRANSKQRACKAHHDPDFERLRKIFERKLGED